MVNPYIMLLVTIVGCTLGVSLGTGENSSRDAQCLGTPFASLAESSFTWDHNDSNLAMRTVYRSTSSWVAREVLLFDPSNDAPLLKFLDLVKAELECQPTDVKIKTCITMVRTALGEGSEGTNRELSTPLGKGGEVVSIGRYIEEQQGVCRHRNYLLKIALEAVGLYTELSRGTVGGGGRHVWLMFNDTLVLDAMWYDQPVSIDQHQSPTLTFDGVPVPLGKCGPSWTQLGGAQHGAPQSTCSAPTHVHGDSGDHTRRIELETMSVSALREFLTSHKRRCRGCVEKAHFVEEALRIRPMDVVVTPGNRHEAKETKAKRKPPSSPSSSNGKAKRTPTSPVASQWCLSGSACASAHSAMGATVHFAWWVCSVLTVWASFLLWWGFVFTGIYRHVSNSELGAQFRMQWAKAEEKAKMDMDGVEMEAVQGTQKCNIKISGCTTQPDTNGRYVLCGVRINFRPVYIKQKKKAVRALVAADFVGIWWTAGEWYVGLFNDLGLQRGFLAAASNATEPKGLSWSVGNGVAFVKDDGVTCVASDGGDNGAPLLDVNSNTFQLSNAMFEEMKQLCNWSDDNTYSHSYHMQRSAMGSRENRMAKFLNGIYIHQMLSLHADAATRASVVPFFWVQFSNAGDVQGTTLTGKGSAMKWEELSRAGRVKAVLQLWEALACLHNAGVEHYDIGKKNITFHNDRLKFIDFDNSLIFRDAHLRCDPRASLDFIRHTSNCPPEYRFNLPRVSASADVFVLAVVSTDVLYENTLENLKESSDCAQQLWSMLDAKSFGLGNPFSANETQELANQLTQLLQQSKVSKATASILQRGMSMIPAERPTAECIFNELNELNRDLWYLDNDSKIPTQPDVR